MSAQAFSRIYDQVCQETDWHLLIFHVTHWGFRILFFGVPCPNFIQILWPELTQKIESEIPNELHGKLGNANLFLDILDRKSGKMPEPTLEQIQTRYQKLYWLLKPILVLPERPMFMKKGDWEKRLRRFEEKQS